MNTTQIPTCLPVRSRLLDPNGLRHIPLPLQRDGAALSQAFLSAPQFADIDLTTLCAQQRGALNVILVGESDYYLQQAAMYLTTLARKDRTPVKKENPSQEKAKAWKKLGVPMLEEDTEGDVSHGSNQVDLSQSLVVVPPTLIDPSLTESPPGQPKELVRVNQLPCAALYIGAPSGVVLNQYIMDQVLSGPQMSAGNPPDICFGLHPNQIDKDLCQALQLLYGFHVCHVGQPDKTYLEQLFRDYAEDCFYTLDDSIDVPTIVTHLQTLRGSAFLESDLEAAVLWAIQRKIETPTTADFCFQMTPLTTEKTGLESLNAMVELDAVKSAIRRLLAMERLGQRRLDAGLAHSPRHRHMAFSGAPGTGKTVCAQLVAQILREEGSGSGRFVEAGREDLVGQYVGHTAPKVAALFEKAQGGVLFLDEIGALVSTGTNADSYTEEAVNALVYHMDRNPETLVIFATYSDEMTAFLTSNPGLSSRIAQQVEFPSYSAQTLSTMFTNLAQERGYTLPETAQAQVESYFATAMARHPRTFGNGREVRKLFNAAEEEMALRTMAESAPQMALTPCDLSTVITRFTPQAPIKRLIGFAV